MAISSATQDRIHQSYEEGATPGEPLKKVVVKNTSSNPVPVSIFSGLVPESYDAIDLTYTGDNITTVQYYSGGLAGTLVATLTISYVGVTSKIDTVVKT